MESRLTVKFQMVISLIEKDLSFYIVSIYKYTIVGELYSSTSDFFQSNIRYINRFVRDGFWNMISS